MSTFSLPLVQLVRENLSLLMDFAFARPRLSDLVTNKFKGEWKYLRTMLFEVSEQRAAKAAIELAMFMRLLDDREDISSYINRSDWGFGNLVAADGSSKPLKMRDVSNKIIHSSHLEWDFSTPDEPVLVCISQRKEKWERAEVNVVALAAFCGGLMA